MKQDPDDQKPPHYDFDSLMRAFEQAWCELKQQKDNDDEIEHTRNHQG